MIAATPGEDIWGYRWECGGHEKSVVTIRAKPTPAPKCPICKHPMLHQTRITPEKP